MHGIPLDALPVQLPEHALRILEEIGGLVLREDPSLVRNKDLSSLEAHREIPERKAKVVVRLVDGGVGERLSQVQTEPVFLLRAKPEFRRFCTVFQLTDW